MAADDFDDAPDTVLDADILVELDAEPRTPVTQPYRLLVCTECGRPVLIRENLLVRPLPEQCARNNPNPDYATEALCRANAVRLKAIRYLESG